MMEDKDTQASKPQDELIYRSEEVHAMVGEQEARRRTITFEFNPADYEMVRAKDGAFIVRKKRPRVVEMAPVN